MIIKKNNYANNIYINEIRRVLYITEIWLSPPNFSRDKEQWKRERHQYDLFEYEYTKNMEDYQ